MVRQFLPLNGLRAFEASARHLSFTRAAIELCVTQAAVSQQVKSLERRLGAALFQRLPRGLKITAEGEALLPTLTNSFDQMAITLDRIEAGQVRELLFLGVVGRLPSAGCCQGFRIFNGSTRSSMCAFRQTIIASIWRPRDWTLPFASAAVPGMAQKRCVCSTLRSLLCARPNWPSV